MFERNFSSAGKRSVKIEDLIEFHFSLDFFLHYSVSPCCAQRPDYKK